MVIEDIKFQVHKSLQRIRERKLANFIPWGPASIQGHSHSDFFAKYLFPLKFKVILRSKVNVK